MNHRIGALKLGGLGDACDFAVILHGIRKQFPESSVVAISDGNSSILKHYADTVIIDKKTDWYELSRRHGWRYDLFYDLRPHSGLVFRGDVYKKEKVLIANNRCGHEDERVNVTVSLAHIHRFNHYNSWATNEMQFENKPVIELNCEAVGIESNYDEARLPINQVDADYITINTGAMGAEKGRKQTKQYHRWQEVVDALVQRGEKIIQLGIKWEKKLKHVEHVWNEPIGVVADYLAKSKLHLGNENGIVRLRRLVTDKPSVVVFGPTHPVMYGFSNNINIWTNVCHPCFWYTGEWMWKCAMDVDCICTRSITPEMILDNIWKLL